MVIESSVKKGSFFTTHYAALSTQHTIIKTSLISGHISKYGIITFLTEEIFEKKEDGEGIFFPPERRQVVKQPP